RVHEFYKTRDFQRGILPVEGSQSGVLKLAQRSDLVSVTSRSVEIGRETKAWVERYFPSMFLGVCFTNAFSLEGERRKKVDVCRELGVKIIIEDSPTIARACYGAGMGVVLLDAPWNRQVDLPEGVVRVNDWGGDC
ncbi:MAG: hypothetical protein KKF39_03365, partial [Nanoarchaeota archaeon]|nr:hypothetical protein [Nanoarchaeota archaeon]